MAPRLTGLLRSADAGTQFDGRFGAPVFVRFFLVTWMCFDLFVLASMINATTTGRDAPPWFAYPFLMVHLLGPFGIAASGMISADDVLARLTGFMTDVGSGQRARSN